LSNRLLFSHLKFHILSVSKHLTRSHNDYSAGRKGVAHSEFDAQGVWGGDLLRQLCRLLLLNIFSLQGRMALADAVVYTFAVFLALGTRLEI
jgi:hypothetical protein